MIKHLYNKYKTRPDAKKKALDIVDYVFTFEHGWVTESLQITLVQ